MSYKENEVVAKYTQGAMQSDCGEYSVHDLVVTSECDDMFVYYNKETECEIECSLELDYEFQQQSE